MKGIEAYSEINSNKIDKFLSNKQYLIGFKNYLSDVADTTIYIYLQHVHNFVTSTQKELKDIDLDDYTSHMAKYRNKVPMYQINVYSALKRYSEYLFVSKKNDTDYMKYIKRPSDKELQSTKQKRDKGYLTKREIGKYLDTVKNGAGTDRAKARQLKWRERDIAIISLFLCTGMRNSGLYKLDVNSIDFQNKTLITTDKRMEIQEYPLDDDILEILKEWLTVREGLVSNDEDALFVSNRGERIGHQGIAKITIKYGVNIDGKKTTPHKLRATYGTQVYNETHDLLGTQQAMGHENPSTTENYIRGQGNKNRKNAAAIMSGIVFKSRKE